MNVVVPSVELNVHGVYTQMKVVEAFEVSLAWDGIMSRGLVVPLTDMKAVLIDEHICCYTGVIFGVTT